MTDTTATLTYVGRRLNDGRINHAYRDQDGNQRWFGGRIGASYTMPVDGTTYEFGKATYVETVAGDEVAGWEAEDFAAAAAKRAMSQAVADKVDQIDSLVEPLQRVLWSLRTRQDRAVVMAEIIRKLHAATI